MELLDRYPELAEPVLLSPRDLGAVSSVSSEVRRLWRSRKITLFDQREHGDSASRHRATWQQACQLACLKAFAEHGADLRLAAEALSADRFSSGDFFFYDRTEVEQDLLLVLVTAAGVAPQVLGHGSSAGALTAPILTDSGSLVWINFSVIQRGLLERYESIRPEILEGLQ